MQITVNKLTVSDAEAHEIGGLVGHLLYAGIPFKLEAGTLEVYPEEDTEGLLAHLGYPKES